MNTELKKGLSVSFSLKALFFADIWFGLPKTINEADKPLARKKIPLLNARQYNKTFKAPRDIVHGEPCFLCV